MSVVLSLSLFHVENRVSLSRGVHVSCGESCFLVSWCAGDRCGMAGSNEDHGWSKRPGVED
jgi:hypothetical protein